MVPQPARGIRRADDLLLRHILVAKFFVRQYKKDKQCEAISTTKEIAVRTIKRILCPVDVYDFQPEAAEYAMALADALGAKITVLYVFESLPPHYLVEGYAILPPSAAENEEAKRKAEAKLEQLLSSFFNSRMEKGEVLFGHAAAQIVQIAESDSADMIVMASHGRSLLGRAIYGSVTTKVLANTNIPVLVVHPSKEQ